MVEFGGIERKLAKLSMTTTVLPLNYLMQLTNPDNFELGSVKRECRNSCSVFVEIDAGQAGRALSARIHANQPAQF